MATILDDKEHRDTHILAGLITLIKCMGTEHARTAASDLTDFVHANDIHQCKQGQHWSGSLNKCVDDIG